MIVYDEDYDAEASESEMLEHTESWAINEDLRFCISEHYKKNTHLGVEVLEKQKIIEENSSDNDSDND